MALTKDKKNEVVAEVAQLLEASKMTVIAKYQGTTVKSLQQLRRDAESNGTVVKVVKNRLVKKAIEQTDKMKDVDTSNLEGMLMYAFNPEDEVAAAQVLNTFAKNEPQIEFVGAINADGVFVAAADVKMLANLPSKDQLRGMLVGTLAAPLTGFVGVMAGNLRGFMNVLNAHSEAIGE